MVGRVDVIEVPFNSSGTNDGVARMPDALVGAGMYEALGRLAELTRARVNFEAPQPVRGPAGLLAEPALVSMVENLSEIVGQTLVRGHWPMVIGGDCAVMLGALLGIRRAGYRSGLLFVDGHEDAWPPHRSPTGEAADSEMGLALGLYPPPAALRAHFPLVGPERVVALGPRDSAELSSATVESIANRVRTVTGGELVKGNTTKLAASAAEHLRVEAENWWLHVDLDVLSTEALPAVDYPQPGGLSWSQLRQLTWAALTDGGCVGASVVIYNPQLDEGAHAEVIVGYLEYIVANGLPSLETGPTPPSN